MADKWVHKIIDKKIAYYRFAEGLTENDFRDLHPGMEKTLAQEEITSLVVVIDIAEPVNEEVGQFWYNVGELAKLSKITKVGVVMGELPFLKKYNFEHQMQGGDRGFETLYVDPEAEADAIAWCR